MGFVFFGITFVKTGAAHQKTSRDFRLQDNFHFFTFVETGAAHETSHHLEQLALVHVTLLLQGLLTKTTIETQLRLVVVTYFDFERRLR